MFATGRALKRALSTYYAAPKYPRNGDKVVIAMSGGVDSSACAKLLADKDYDLSAVFMRNWDTRDESGTDRGCEWEKDWEDVQRVCKKMDIPCTMVDLSREYWLRVFEPSLKSWEAGDTPNPDIWCNKEVKFGALLPRLAEDTQFVATGHYARKHWHPTNHRPMLLRPADRTKDQTYFLSAIPEPSLAKTLFPLADLHKDEVRAIARNAGLHNADREESMGICFVGEKRKFTNFLANYIPPKPGVIRDLVSGRELGTHAGLWTFTIGQGAKIKGLPHKMFVARKDKAANEILVVPDDHPELFASALKMRDWAWIWRDAPPATIDTPEGFRARVQFRRLMMDIPCTVRRDENDGEIVITFDEPQKAVALGQVAVLWDDNWCLGCGTIEDAIRPSYEPDQQTL